MSCNFLDFGQASARILITNADNGPTVRRSGMSNINVRALATMGIQKNYLRNIIKASYAMKVTS